MRSLPCAFVVVMAFSSCGCGEASEVSTDPVVTAHVRLEVLTRRDLIENLSLYGLVMAGPESGHASSVTFDCVIRRVFVREGEGVVLGDALVEVAPSRDARLALRQARAAATTAEAALGAIRERLASGLATRVELAAAERQARAATIDVQSLVRRGVGGGRDIRAAGPGVVRAIHGGVGDLVPANDSIVDLDLARHREVRLGLELEDAGRVATGDAVIVSDLGMPARTQVDAVVRAVGESVNSDTRLIDLYAALPDNSGLLLNQRVAGTLAVHSGPVLVVPCTALVPLPDGVVVFTVDAAGTARSHGVRVGMESGTEAEVWAPSLSEGVRVVVAGAAVLSDGMHTVEDPG